MDTDYTGNRQSLEMIRCFVAQYALRNSPIGRLVPKGDGSGFVVMCHDCAEHRTDAAAPIFHENIYPYRQVCDACKRVLVEGRPGWPVLFE